MGQNIIELGFNIEELTAEKKQVLDLFVDLFGKLQEYDGTKFNPLGKGGLVDLKKSLTDGAAAMAAFGETAQQYNKVVTEQYQKQQAAKKSTDDLTLATKAYQQIVDQTAQAAAKNNAAGSDAASGLAAEREALRQRNAELAAAAKLQLAEGGSINEAKEAAHNLRIERDKLNITTDEGIARQTELNQKIDEFDAFIKKNVSTLEQTKINIGNYSGSLSTAFDSVKEQLQTVNKQLAEMEVRGKSAFTNLSAGQQIGFNTDRFKGNSSVTDLASGGGSHVSILNQDTEAYQKLTLQQKVLEGSLQRQTIGFKTANQEMRGVKNTLDTMALAGLGNTEAFDKLSVAYTENERKVKDLHREQAILTTDAPGLTALTGIAKGLGGAYALGAGAAQLFATGNEKLDKELNKLVAVMTFLQGLEAAVGALKTKNAIATALETETEKALTYVKQVEIAIFGQSATVTKAEAEAKLLASKVTIENAEASEVDTVSKVAETGAIEGLAGATEVATVATIGLGTALTATGVGVIILALIYGIAKLVGVIEDWITADERAEKTQEALNQETIQYIGTVEQLQQVLQASGRQHIDDLTKQAQLQADAGKNQFIQLANERQISQARLDLAKKIVDQNKITQASVDDLNNKQRVALELQGAAENALRHSQKENGEQNTTLSKERLEIAEQDAKDAKNIADVATKSYLFQFNGLKEFYDNKHALADTDVKIQKAADEQLAKLTADAAQRRYDIEKAASDRILNLPTSSFSERENAVKAGYRADEELANAHIAAIRLQIEQQTITEAAGADEIANIENEKTLKYKKAVDDRVKLRTEERDRNLTAQNSIDKNDNEGDAAVQEAITKDTQRELDTRLDALKKNISDKAAVIAEDFNTQIKLHTDLNGKTTLLDKEYEALVGDRDKNLVALTADTQKQIFDIVTSYGEKKLKAIEELNKTGSGGNAATEGYNQETDALNTALINRTISYSRFLVDKKILDQKYAIDKAAADVKDDEVALQRIKDFEIKENGIKLEFARIALDLAKQGGNDKEIADAQAKFDSLKAIQVKANADEVAATKKLNDDTLALHRAKVKPTEEIDALIAEREKQIAVDSYNLAKTLVDASYENKINQIQTVIDKTDEQYNQEIAAVQRSTLSQQQQAAEVIILTAQKNAQDISLKNQQKKEKIAEAKFDRDVALAEVAWNTAKAIMKDIAGVPFPASLAIAAADAALGAIQAATILAKPIPTYGDGIGIPGKGRHPGGDAIVGERWTPERVSIPGYEPFILDKPTLLNLPADSSVMPMTPSELVWEIGTAGMARTAAQFSQPTGSGNEAWDVARWQASQFKKAINKSNRKIINKIEVHVDADWNNYVNKKVLGRG